MHVQTKQKAMEELTAGQAGTLARNEQVMDKTAEEIEDLEEVLTESITDSIRGKRQKAEAAADGSDAKAKRRCFLSASWLCMHTVQACRCSAVGGNALCQAIKSRSTVLDNFC